MKNNDLVVVVSNANVNNNFYETINAIKNVRFKNVFIQWYNRNWNPSQEEQLEYIKEQGLNINYAHLSYDDIKDLWLPDGDYLVDRYINDLNVCKKNGISTVMMHITSSEKQEYNELGINRLKQIVEYAEEIDIKIAFENVRYKGCLEYVFENINSKNIGICFDSGHYHCYYKDDFNFLKFKDKIFAVHLHDNFGLNDQHLIPFDGNINWQYIIKNLKECNYNGPIILEIVYTTHYLQEDINEFYKKGYKAGLKLNNMYKKL